MKPTTSIAAILALLITNGVQSFSFLTPTRRNGLAIMSKRIKSSTSTTLKMGLFDGVKDAFGAPALEQSILDKERETPIDRWFGWNAVGSKDESSSSPVARAEKFVDSMDSANYISVELEKPMGVVFEENDENVGGIFVLSLKEGGIAEKNGVLKPGDQLVAVGETKVTGNSFDEALGTIINSEKEKTRLILFRGSAKDLYGPTGASQEWLDEFISK